MIKDWSYDIASHNINIYKYNLIIFAGRSFFPTWVFLTVLTNVLLQGGPILKIALKLLDLDKDRALYENAMFCLGPIMKNEATMLSKCFYGQSVCRDAMQR